MGTLLARVPRKVIRLPRCPREKPLRLLPIWGEQNFFLDVQSLMKKFENCRDNFKLIRSWVKQGCFTLRATNNTLSVLAPGWSPIIFELVRWSHNSAATCGCLMLVVMWSSLYRVIELPLIQAQSHTERSTIAHTSVTTCVLTGKWFVSGLDQCCRPLSWICWQHMSVFYSN